MRAPTNEDLQALLHKIITRLMMLLTRRDVLVLEDEGGSSYLADADSAEARAFFDPRAGQNPHANIA